jgi:hypothetical protein
MIRRYLYRGRHRAPARRPPKGSPLTLPETFWWTLFGAGYVMLAVVGIAYTAQSNDPAQVRYVCQARWDCDQQRPDVAVDTSTPPGATP